MARRGEGRLEGDELVALVAVEPSVTPDDCEHERLVLAMSRDWPTVSVLYRYDCERCGKSFPDVRGLAHGGEEVRGCLEDHEANLANLRADANASKKLARDLGKSRERMFGYFEGVSWAYRWFLGDEEKS